MRLLRVSLTKVDAGRRSSNSSWLAVSTRSLHLAINPKKSGRTLAPPKTSTRAWGAADGRRRWVLLHARSLDSRGAA